MTVNTFDPSQLGNPIDGAAVRELVQLGLRVDEDLLTLSEHEAARFAPLATHADWAQQCVDLADEEIVGLIRLFTLGEMQYSNWAAGDKSPVVALVKALKARDAYDVSLTKWIKSHTTNKFLPHGSLMARL